VLKLDFSNNHIKCISSFLIPVIQLRKLRFKSYMIVRGSRKSKAKGIQITKFAGATQSILILDLYYEKESHGRKKITAVREIVFLAPRKM